MIQSQGHLPSCVPEQMEWLGRGTMLQDGSLVASEKVSPGEATQLSPHVGRVLSSPKLAGQSSRKPGRWTAFQRLGSSLPSLLCRDTEQRASTSGSCLPKLPNAWPHSFTHSFTLVLHTHLSRPRSSVAGTGDTEMNNTRNAVVKELALWEGRKPTKCKLGREQQSSETTRKGAGTTHHGG